MRPMQRSVTAALLAVTALSAASCSGDDASGPAASRPEDLLTVSVSPKLDTLPVGASRQFIARVSDARNNPREHPLTWQSADPTIASVSAAGVVSAVAAGRTQLIVNAGGKPDSATIVVVPAITSLSITPGAMQVVMGDTLVLAAAAHGPAGVAASTQGVRWTTSDPSVAIVSENGVVSTFATGDATITAELLGNEATAAVQVVRNSVASIAVAPTNSSMYPAQTQQLVATLLDTDGRPVTTPSLKWSSSDPSVATVSEDGRVTGLAKGMTVITVQAQGKRATATVNVFAVPVASVTVSLAANSLSAGQSTQAQATLHDADGHILAGRVVAWQSSNPALATVTSTGLVSAVANGSVAISAISEGKIGSASVTISDPIPASIEIAPSSVALVAGQSARLVAEVLDANGVVIPNQAVSWSSAESGIVSVTAAGVVTGLAIGTTTVRASAQGLTTSATVSVSPIRAASLSVTPTTSSIEPEKTVQLVATVRDANGNVLADRVVTWSSTAGAIASVSSTGLVAGVGAGSATITAQVDEVSANSTITVTTPPPAPVAAVSVTLPTDTLKIGQTTQATATLTDAAGNVLPGRAVVWSSANPEVATVSSTGLVTAVAAGSASIMAVSEGRTGGATLTVAAPLPAPVATVSLAATATSLFVGQTTQLTVTLKDAAGNVLTGRTIGWTSSNTSLATVSPTGLVTAVSAGTPTITAVSEGKSGSISISIAAPVVPVASVEVVPGAAALEVGGARQFAATVRDAAGAVLSGRAVAWATSDAAVASVTGAGLVTAEAAGAATLTATSEGVAGRAALTVAAAPPPGGGACRLVTGTEARAAGPLAKPGYLQSVVDPAFGTTLTRVSGDPGTPIPVVGGTWPQVAGPAYAKVPAWSADGAYLLLSVAGAVGGGVSLVLDGATYRVVGKAGPAPSYAWHPSAPDVLIGVTGGGAVVTHNVRTGATATRVAASGYTGGWLGKGEGNPSTDGRYVPVVARRAADGREVVYVADAVAGTKSADLDPAAQGFSDLDWAGVSQSGRYLFLFGTADGVWGRAKVYDRATLARVHYWTDYPTGHSDLGVDAAGNDVIFGVVGAAPYAHHFIARRLDTGAIADLTGAVASYNWHATTRNTARPGWGYAATNDRRGYPLDGEVYAVKLDGSGLVERYAHHRANVTDYDAHPFPVPAPDGRRVLFRSNWGASGGRPVQAYVADARPLCP